jgi:hypothetical protein
VIALFPSEPRFRAADKLEEGNFGVDNYGGGNVLFEIQIKRRRI